MFQNGRLGNQLFQYSGMVKYFPDHITLLIGFDELISLICNINAVHIGKKIYKKKLILIFFECVIKLFGFIRLISVITEDYDDSGFSLKTKLGLFPFIKLINKCYFQNILIDSKLVIHEYLQIKAKKIISDNVRKGYLPVFIHIRRGDYVNWPNKIYPAVLSLSWYLTSIQYVEKTIKNPFYIILTDDVPYVLDFIENLDNFYISKNNSELDLVIMAECNSGILSASTFSWWGAYLSYKNNNFPVSLYVAPKYWISHRLKKWPLNLRKSFWLHYI